MAAVAVFYGKPLDGGAEELRAVGCPVLGVFGTADAQFPAQVVDEFESNLEAAMGVDGRVVRYEGEGHAFVKDIEEIKRGGSAGAAWGEFISFLEAKL